MHPGSPPVCSSRGRYYDSLVGLQVSYLGPDNFGDVFSVANKAANRCDSGRVQPRILFLVVPLRVPQFIPLGRRGRGCNWLQDLWSRVFGRERLEISLTLASKISRNFFFFKFFHIFFFLELRFICIFVL